MIVIGTKCRLEQTVTRELTAEAIGSGALPVFGTPFMAAMMENAALTAMQTFLDEGQGSVGTHLDIHHNAPTPIGMKVWAEAEVTGDPARLRAAERIILPGVGAFGDARRKLDEAGLVPVLREEAAAGMYEMLWGLGILP